MANYLSQYAPRRSFGFAGQEGDLFDVANQPNMLANIISNESIAAQGAPRNYLQRTGGQMIDLGESAPMNNLRGSIVDVFGQGKGYMQPDGTIVGVNQAGQKFRVQPEGTQAAQMQARMFAEDRARKAAEADMKRQEWELEMQKRRADLLKTQETPQDKAQAERVQTATDALDLIQQAKGIFDQGKATESWLGKARDVAASTIGKSTEGAQASAQLKALGGALVSKMPKMSGPQSDKDVALYREMAGQIADETIPLETRKAALQTVEQIQRKYAGLNSQQPSATSQDAEAIAWAKANPNDPRAAKILSLHGM